MGASFDSFYDRVNSDDIVRFVVRFKVAHNGIAPSSREIMQKLDISSTSVLHYHMSKLEADGRITYPLGRSVARAIGVPGYEFRAIEPEDFR